MPKKRKERVFIAGLSSSKKEKESSCLRPPLPEKRKTSTLHITRLKKKGKGASRPTQSRKGGKKLARACALGTKKRGRGGGISPGLLPGKKRGQLVEARVRKRGEEPGEQVRAETCQEREKGRGGESTSTMSMP